jgi:hypothetical protein
MAACSRRPLKKPISARVSDRPRRGSDAGGIADHAGSRLAPKDRITQCFGLFALTGKVTSFLGPPLIGLVTAAANSQKAGMAVLVLFFASGLILLTRVKAEAVRARPV